MPENVVLYLLIVVAIGIGWWLGWRERLRFGARRLADHYVQGVSLLLEGRPDRALSTFVRNSEVNGDTLETHLAFGSLLRKRGEMDRAVILHQHLLARPGLSRMMMLEIKLELARDYLLAGLLGRAENLLVEIVREGGDIRRRALELLVGIYEQEKEWQRAIDVVVDLRGWRRRDPYAAIRLSHFHCELAELALQAGELRRADDELGQALSEHPQSVRASLLQGRAAYQQGRSAQAVAALERIEHQDVRYVPLALDMMERCYRRDRDELDIDRLRAFLERCLERGSATSVVLMLSRIERQQHGDKAAAHCLAKYLKASPTVRGLAQLINLHIDNASGAARDNLVILRSLAEALLADKPTFRCHECGFMARRMHWSCPTCKSWNSVELIFGLEGE